MNNIIGKKFKDIRVIGKVIVKIIQEKKDFYKIEVIESRSFVVSRGFVTTFNKELFGNKRFIPLKNKIKKLG